jgi:hypothetical protein
MDTDKLNNVCLLIDDYLLFNQVFPNDIYKDTLEEIITNIDNEKDIINQTKINEYCKKLIEANNVYNTTQKTITQLYDLMYRINEYYEAVNIYSKSKLTINIKLQEDRHYSEDRSVGNISEHINLRNNVIEKENKVLEVIDTILYIKKEYYS